MKGGRIGTRALLVVVLLWTVVPLAWMLISSFKPSDKLTASPPSLAFTPTLEHYRSLFGGANDIGGYIENSLLAAGISTIIAVALGCLAGYGLGAAGSAARTTSRSGSSRPAWRRSRRSSCRCS